MEKTLKKSGTVRVNLAEKDGWGTVMESFGGEDYLAQKFPRILKMIQDTAKQHGQLRAGAAENAPDFQEGMTFALYDGRPQAGAETAGAESAAEADAEAGAVFHALTELKLTKTAASIVTSTEIYKMEEGNPIVVGSGTALDEDTDNASFDLPAKAAQISGGETTLYGHSVAHCVFVNQDGKPTVETFEARDSIYEDWSKSKPVVSLEVADPYPKPKTGTYISISYARTHMKDYFDYSYPDARYEVIDKTKYVTVYLQFKVKITLNPLFEIYAKNPFDKDSFRAHLESFLIDMPGGVVPFNKSTIDQTVKTEVSGNVMTLYLNTPCYWNTKMPLAALSAIEGIFDFHLQFKVNYRTPVTPEKVYQTYVIASTRDDIQPGPSVVKIPKKLKIMWGCLGGDTIVKTENGDKKIADVTAGDRVLAEDGEYVKVTDIVSGGEPGMILVNAFNDDHPPLLLTANHLIKTRRGPLAAEELNAADDLETADGGFAAITDLRAVPYTGKVYSLALEKPVYHVANGFLAAPSNVAAPAAKAAPPPPPLDPALARELKEWAAARKAGWPQT